MRLLPCILLLSALAQAAEPVRCPDGPSRLAMEQGEYMSRPGLVFGLQHFSANMVPRGKKLPICLSKITDIDHGRVVVSDSSLSTMFNQKMKRSPKQSISDISVHTKSDGVAIKGKVHKKIAVPFEIDGHVDTANGGRVLRLHAEKIKAMGVPVKGLLKMLGVELGSLINPDATKGVSVQGDSILFDPEQLDNIRGHITKVQIMQSALVVDFAPLRKLAQSK